MHNHALYKKWCLQWYMVETFVMFSVTINYKHVFKQLCSNDIKELWGIWITSGKWREGIFIYLIMNFQLHWLYSIKWWDHSEWWIGTKWFEPILRHYPSICPVWLKKTTKSFSQNRWSLGWLEPKTYWIWSRKANHVMQYLIF